MRGPEGNIDYAQSRLQARHGERLTATEWRLLETSRDLQHFLAATSHSALARWVAGLAAQADAHEIERRLRREWTAYVQEIAAWLPHEWRPALDWLRWLPQLQAVARLALAEPAPAWMFSDPVFGPVAPGSPLERARALESSDLAPLAAAVRGESTAIEAWLERWSGLVPPADRDARECLALLERLLAKHAAAAGAADQSLDPLRQDLERRLGRLFRRAASTPVAALCHLALLALDYERLRGDLILRATLERAARSS